MTVALAGLHAAIHALRILAENGLVTPKDADETLDGIMETLEQLPEKWQQVSMSHFDSIFVEIRSAAAENWRAQK